MKHKGAFYLVLSFILSLCSITYEVMIARAFVAISDQSVLWQSLTVGIYVAALGFGTYLSTRMPPRDPGARLVQIELLLSVIGACSVVLIYGLYVIYRVFALGPLARILHGAPLFPLDVFILCSQSVTVVIGILSGFEVPLVCSMAERSGLPQFSNKILAANYLGTLAGTFLFAFVLFPWIDVAGTALAVGGLNFLACFAILIASERRGQAVWSKRAFALGSLTLVTLGGLAAGTPWVQGMALKARHYISMRATALGRDQPSLRSLALQEPVQRLRSPYQYVEIVPRGSRTNLDGEIKDFDLFLDNHFQFNSRFEAMYHEYFIHVPVQLMGKVPQKVLVLGGGDGLAVRELLRYGDRIQSIRKVELDPEMVSLARTHPDFLRLNQNAMGTERKTVEVTIDDAFTFLRRHNELFDAIFIDFPYPFNYDLSRLYSLEFYRHAALRLAPNGFVVLDYPLFRSSDPAGVAAAELNDVIASTLDAAGFQGLFGYGGETARGDRETFVLATREPLSIGFSFQKFIPEGHVFLTPTRLRELGKNPYLFRIDPQHVNSLFRPKLLRMRSHDL